MPATPFIPRGNDKLIAGRALNELGTTQPLYADTSTGRLLVSITTDAGGATGVTGNARIDGNNVATLLAVSSDGSGTLIPLARDSSGNLLCDVISG